MSRPAACFHLIFHSLAAHTFRCRRSIASTLFDTRCTHAHFGETLSLLVVSHSWVDAVSEYFEKNAPRSSYLQVTCSLLVSIVGKEFTVSKSLSGHIGLFATCHTKLTRNNPASIPETDKLIQLLLSSGKVNLKRCQKPVVDHILKTAILPWLFRNGKRDTGNRKLFEMGLVHWDRSANSDLHRGHHFPSLLLLLHKKWRTAACVLNWTLQSYDTTQAIDQRTRSTPRSMSPEEIYSYVRNIYIFMRA